MTNEQFSNQFDVLHNNLSSNNAPGLNEWEKSVLLTKAQDEILKSYFSSKTNKTFDGFDGNEIRQIDFSTLIKSKTYQGSSLSGEINVAVNYNKIGSVKSIEFPSDVLVVLNEFVLVHRVKGTKAKEVQLAVLPIDYSLFTILQMKPYKRPMQYQAWKLMTTSESDRRVEIIAGNNDTIEKYTIRYIKRPKPIILEDLTGSDVSLGVDENGNPYTKAQECELDPILHEEILQRAVELAKLAYNSQAAATDIVYGGASATAIGIPGASNNNQRDR